MDDLRDLLHQAVEPLEPSGGGLERVRHSVKRRRLRQRISAGVVGLTLAVGAISIAILALQEDPVDRPGPVSALVPTWTAEIRDAAMGSAVLQDADRVYVPTARGGGRVPQGVRRSLHATMEGGRPPGGSKTSRNRDSPSPW